MTLDDLWKLTRRHLALILACALAGLVLAFAWMQLQDKQYSASAAGYVTAGGGNSIADSYASQNLAQQKAQSYATLVSNRSVMEAVIETLSLDTTPQELATRVSSNLPEDGVTITVNATAGSPQQARDIADAVVVATAAEAKRMEESGPARSVVSSDGGTEDVAPQAQVLIEPSESAILPSGPSWPRPTRVLPFGLLAGLAVGYVVAAIRHRNDTKLRHVDDVEKISTASVLGVLPASKDLGSERGKVRHTKSFHEREALRKLRTNLRFVDVDNQPRSVVITSANQGEGKSTVAANLAVVLAESGQRVALVDADLRRPAVSRAFDLDGTVGLTQVLSGSVGLHDALQITDVDNLHILSAGETPPNPSELLGSHRMETVIEQLALDHFVILDAPPLLPVTDAALLTRSADGAVLVVAAGSTHRAELERAVLSLRGVQGKLLGSILNRASTRRVDRIRYGDAEYGYSRGYYRNEYEYSANGSKPAKESRPSQGSHAKEPAPVSRRDKRARERSRRVKAE